MKTLLSIGLLVFAVNSWANRELCQRNMETVYSDGKATIDIFLGFYDNSPLTYVSNFKIKAIIEEFLTRPCKDTGLCGFRRTRVAGQFRKRFQAYGGAREVIVNLHNSATEEANPKANPGQKTLSDQTDADFQERTRSGEIVLYLGHSRYGGGPDFHVPKVRRSDGHVDKAYYQRQRSGVTKLNRNLRGSTVKFYGSFSCDSINHFNSGIKASYPNVSFLGTTRTPSYEENNKVMLWALANLIDGECDFVEDVQRRNLPGGLRFEF